MPRTPWLPVLVALASISVPPAQCWSADPVATHREGSPAANLPQPDTGPTPRADPDPDETEDAAFAEAQQAGAADGYRRYLSRFPTQAPEHVRKAREEMTRLAFEAARSADNPGTYEAYLADYPDGAQAAEVRERLLQLRIKEVLAGNDLDAHRALLGDPRAFDREPLRLHALDLLKREIAANPGKAQREALVSELDRYSRDVFVEVRAKSWRQDAPDYQVEVLGRLPYTSGNDEVPLRAAATRNDAQILMRLTVDERKGRQYFGDVFGVERKGVGTDIAGTLEVTNLLSGRTYLARRFDYRLPEWLMIHHSAGDGAWDAILAREAREGAMTWFPLRYRWQVLAILLGDTADCGALYATLQSDRSNTAVAVDLLRRTRCTPSTAADRVAWAIATGDQADCAREGRVCYDAICSLTDQADADRFFPWLRQGGAEASGCLCQQLGQRIEDPTEVTGDSTDAWATVKGLDRFATRHRSLNVRFQDVLNALVASSKEQAVRCLEAYRALPERDFTITVSEVVKGKIRERTETDKEGERTYRRFGLAISVALERLERPDSDPPAAKAAKGKDGRTRAQGARR